MATNSRLIKDSLLPEGKEDEELLKIIKAEGFKDYEITMSSGAERGDNFTGTLVNIEVKGHSENGEAKQLNLITKCSPRLGDFRNMMPITQFYIIETFMYNTYFPAVFNILKEYGLDNDKALRTKLFSIPKVYGASAEPMDEFMIMNNKKCENYKMGNRMEPLDDAHCRLVLKQLGYLHGLSYALKYLYPEKFAEIAKTFASCNVFENAPEQMVAIYRAHITGLVEMGKTTLDPETNQLEIDKIVEFSKIAFDEYMMGLLRDRSKFDPKYSVVIHGDAWTNNFLFKYDELGNLTDDMVFLDFQLSRCVSPAIELLYFLAVSVSTELRKNSYNELLEIYYSRLSEMLFKFNLEPYEVLPRTVLESDMKKFGGYMIVVGAQALAFHTTKSEDIPDFQTMTLDESEKFMLEAKKMSKNDSCQSRFKGIILFAIEHGFI